MKTREIGSQMVRCQPAAASGMLTPVQAVQTATVQLVAQQIDVDQSPRMLLQRRVLDAAFGGAIQRQTDGLEEDEPVQTQAAPVNETGMPNQLKAGIESLSGMDMSDVRVHRNSDKPAQLNALAYAQGNDIHLGPGQEQHLPHEAWHVVQQRQGRVLPTMQMAGVQVNDDEALEREADSMGTKAVQRIAEAGASSMNVPINALSHGGRSAAQRRHIGAALGSASERAVDSAGGVAQMTTQIRYTRGTITYRRAYAGGAQWAAPQNVGVDTEAYLDPGDAKTGSRTGGGVGIYASGLYRAINGGAALRQGHLLNANLGGQAIAENLFPICTDMNHAHSTQIEEQVKMQLLRIDASRNNPATAGAWNNRRLYYRVRVVGHPNLGQVQPNNLRQAGFRVNAYITNNLNPNGNGGVAADLALGNINMVVTRPFDLNTQLDNLGFAPDAGPTHVLGPQLVANGAPVVNAAGRAVHAVHDAGNNVVPDTTIVV